MEDNELQKLNQQALTFPEEAKTIAINDSPTLLAANEFIHAVKAMIKEIKDFFKPLKTKAKEAHQALVDKEKEILNPLEQAEEIVKPQIASYLAEQDRIRREAEDKARKEEEERKRIEEEKLKAAREAVFSGNAKEAERILDEEIPEAKPFIPLPEPPKPEGTSVRKIPKWRLIDEKKIPRDFLILDSAKITRLVKETKGQIQIPGIEVYFEDSVAVRV